MSSNDDRPIKPAPSLADPNEPDLPYRLINTRLEHHTRALGYVCVTLATLERHLNGIIEDLVPCTEQVRRIIVENLGTNLSTRCNFVIQLSAASNIYGEWTETLSEQLVYIQNEILPPRNRYVHDPWLADMAETGQPKQADQRIKLRKPSAFSKKELTPVLTKERRLEDMWLLVRNISQINKNLAALRNVFGFWRELGHEADIRAKCPLPPKWPHP